VALQSNPPYRESTKRGFPSVGPSRVSAGQSSVVYHNLNGREERSFVRFCRIYAAIPKTFLRSTIDSPRRSSGRKSGIEPPKCIINVDSFCDKDHAHIAPEERMPYRRYSPISLMTNSRVGGHRTPSGGTPPGQNPGLAIRRVGLCAQAYMWAIVPAQRYRAHATPLRRGGRVGYQLRRNLPQPALTRLARHALSDSATVK
jgi:hypothetical protein